MYAYGNKTQKTKKNKIQYGSILKIWYGIGHTIAAFQINYGPHQQSPLKGPEAHGNENNLLDKHFPRKVPHINKPVMLYV